MQITIGDINALIKKIKKEYEYYVFVVDICSIESMELQIVKVL